MDTNVFLIILLATVMHAIWNGMVKKHSDKLVAVSGIVFGHVPLSVIAIFLLPAPTVDSIPYIIASAFIHQGYQWYLLKSYKVGDLTKVYPIARGFGPFVATIISIFLFWKIVSLLTNSPFPLYQAFIVAPLGFISMALPLAPSGLGVGHAIFGTLLSFFHIKQGASLFNVYFICVVFFNLTGAIPYTLSSLGEKTKKSFWSKLRNLTKIKNQKKKFTDPRSPAPPTSREDNPNSPRTQNDHLPSTSFYQPSFRRKTNQKDSNSLAWRARRRPRDRRTSDRGRRTRLAHCRCPAGSTRSTRRLRGPCKARRPRPARNR